MLTIEALTNVYGFDCREAEEEANRINKAQEELEVETGVHFPKVLVGEQKTYEDLTAMS